MDQDFRELLMMLLNLIKISLFGIFLSTVTLPGDSHHSDGYNLSFSTSGFKFSFLAAFEISNRVGDDTEYFLAIFLPSFFVWFESI